MVSVDGGIPLVSHAYPGDRPDVTQFPAMVEELVARFGAARRPTRRHDGSRWSSTPARTPRTTTNCSRARPLHFVGSLPPSDHPDLLAVPTSRYRPVDKARFGGLTAFETTKVVFGDQRRIVVTHSQNLHDKQSRGFDQTLAKARRQLGELAARLARGKTRKPRHKVEAEIAEILQPRWVCPGHLGHPDRRHPRRPAPDLADQTRRPGRPRRRTVRQTRPLHRQRRLAPTAEIVADYRSQVGRSKPTSGR